MLLHLLTAHSQMSLEIGEDGRTMLYALGPRLLCPDDIGATAPDTAWPLVSTDLDERAPQGNYSGESSLNVRLADGTAPLQLRHHSHVREQIDGGTRLRIELRDPQHPALHVTVTLCAYEEEDVFTQQVRLQNVGSSEMLLLRADSLSLRLRADAYTLSAFRGAWAGENYLSEQALARGLCTTVGSRSGIQNAQAGTPGFLLSLGAPAGEETGCCLLGALYWSGNYELSFKHSDYGHLFLRAGHDFAHSPYRLPGKQTLDLPEAVVTLSCRGKGEASRRLHRHLRRRVLPRGQEARRCLLNSWEGVHFGVSEETVLEMIDACAELGGIDLFVLDDGWFGRRDDDSSSLGDWRPDTRKLPHGLAPLCERAARHGLGFGIWVEPEMVSPHSQLYRAHPTWALQLAGREPKQERRQLVLDLCNPAVQNYILDSVFRLLRDNPGISYVKWDCNRKISDAGSPWLPPSMQGNLPFDYTQAYYGIMRRLRESFPQVTFQGCSAGGARLDLGAAALHEEFWLSDNTDPHDRLCMQWSAGYFFPANALGCHVTASPNLYTGRESSLKYRFDVALAGRLGLELDPRRLSADEKAELRQRLALARELRDIVQLGELYRLVSPYDGPDSAVLYRRGSRALLIACTTQRHFTHQHARVPLRGLDADRRYRLRELGQDTCGSLCPLNGCSLGGDALMSPSSGLPIRWNRPQQSCLMLFEEESL